MNFAGTLRVASYGVVNTLLTLKSTLAVAPTADAEAGTNRNQNICFCGEFAGFA